MREKQKAKRLYGITESQFLKYVKLSNKKQGDTEVLLRSYLEMRLDNVVYRLGLASSRFNARQRVSHGHFLVNGKKLDIPSYLVRVGDEITVKKKSLFARLEDRLAKHDTPSWLLLDPVMMSGKVTSAPQKTDFDTSFDTKHIIEFYSR